MATLDRFLLFTTVRFWPILLKNSVLKRDVI